MATSRRKFLLSGLVVLILVLAMAGAWVYTARAQRMVNTDLFGVAINGYDTVSYFTEGRPEEGSTDYEVEWSDARWRFANAEHRDLFLAAPERYTPQYGGFCADYLTSGGIGGVDPETWVIVDGKLYLNWDEEGRDQFLARQQENIDQADANWQKHRERL